MNYRKRPVVIQAVRWDGTNLAEVQGLAGSAWNEDGSLRHGAPGELIIPTLEGDHRARIGDWIIRGVQGEIYPCKPSIFDATYEAVEVLA